MKADPQTLPVSGTTTRTRLIVVDEQSAIRGFLRETLGRRDDYEIVAEGRTGTEALRLCRQFEPRVLIMELMLPEVSAATVVAELRTLGSPTRTLIFTGSRNEAALLAALRARPHGLVHKDESLPALWQALRTVARGGCSISPSLGSLHDRMVAEPAAVELSTRERVVLQMIAEGQPSKAIAESVGVSLRAIEHNRESLIAKLNAHDIATLTRRAVQFGLVD
jgi:DNA-binding NarL/FixJ family response regulator